MEMSLEQYILNPMGKNNAVLSAASRESTRAIYKKKFDEILLRENGKIDYNLYYESKKNIYWAHFKIPSETIRNFYYDVVFKFYADQKIEAGGEDLFKYNVEFYSNDPAFVYTFAYVFNKNKLLIKELAPKMSKEAIKKEAKVKNPYNLVGYVKTIYFAYLTMQYRKLNKKIRFDAEVSSFNLKKLLGEIEDADDKIRDRQEAAIEHSKKKEELRKKIELNKIKQSGILSIDHDKTQVGVTKTISGGNKSSKVKTTKIIKSTKKK